LEDILRAAHGAEVPVLLSTVAVNLKECAPFASMHGPGLDKNQEAEWNKLYQEGIDQEAAGSNQAALVFYQQAARIDPRYADLQFRMGTCDLALTNREQSLRDFELARDYDALDFRADTRINSAIKAAAARHAGQGVQLVDAAGDLAQKSADGIPGLELFYEHVHLNFAGNYLLARDFAGQIEKILPATISAHDRGSWASEKFCEARLAVTVWDRQRVWQPILTRVTAPPFTGQFNHEANLKVYEAKAREAAAALSTQTPEQAREIYRQALERAPDDYFLHGNYQRFLEAGGYLSEAIVEAKRCCELVPQLPGGFYYTATLLVREGKSAEAREYLAHALAIDGHYVEALDEMGEILANQQKTAEAMDWFHRAIRANPGHVNTYLDWGFFQQQQGQTAEAMANYQKAASRQPEGPADYFYRANVAASLFHWDEALACLQAVVKADPGFWQAHYQLGIQLAAKGEVRAAEAQFADTIRLRPDFIAAHLDLGTALWSLGKTNQALATYQGVLQLDPGNKKAEEEIGFIQQASTPAR
jgi:tetratricopeptide (TPR) repeat protein